MASLAIVSSADSKFFPLLRELIASIRDKPPGSAVPLYIMDAGLSPEEKTWLAQQRATVVPVPWPYEVDVTGPQRALAMRCRIPALLQRHDIYLWLDADTWVQDWAAVELYCSAAAERGFCMTAEVDRSFNLGALIQWNTLVPRRIYGDGIARRLAGTPLLNAGVFAGLRDAPHWAAWQRRVEETLSTQSVDFFLDQIALNLIAYVDGFDIAVLPPHYNWVCNRALPRATADGKTLLDPQPPYQPLGIVHMADTSKRQAFVLRTMDGGLIVRSLRYAAKPAKPANLTDPSASEIELAIGEAATYWPQRAVHRLSRLVTSDPNNGRALIALGEAAMLNGDWSEAVRALRRGAALEPRHANVHARLGAIYLHQGRGEEAAAALHRALELAPTTPNLAQQLEAAAALQAMPPKDYVSPGLLRVKPDRHFPDMIVGNPNDNSWPYLRRGSPHNWYVDRRNRTVGFVSRDEAHILFNTALLFEGKRALEIGCFLGFSTFHLALGGVRLDVVDPLLRDPAVMTSVSNSLDSAGIIDACRLMPASSPGAVERLGQREGRRWELAFIDGDHEGEAPRRDAQACERFLSPDALVLFHDLLSPNVAAGLDFFRERGWKTRLYLTSQIMGVAWRGAVNPIMHSPDPALPRDLPPHLSRWAMEFA